MSLGPVASIDIGEEWVPIRTIIGTPLRWNAVQPAKYTFKGQVRKPNKLYINVPDRIVTDEFYAEYILL